MKLTDIPENKLEGESLSSEELLKISIFEGVPPALLDKNRGAVVRRRFRKGDLICREGEYGSTAFYIIKGTTKVFINTPFSHVSTASQTKSRWGVAGLISKMKSLLTKTTETAASQTPQFIPIDAPVDLNYKEPMARLNAGDLFGEMTCLSRYPRSATVVAETDCEMLEMLQNMLQVCQRNPVFKKRLDDTYRERALANHLRSVPILSGVDDAFIEYLRQRVELVSVEPGTVIFKEGDVGDAFYIIRIGFVKVSKKFPGGDMVLSYLPRSAFFGEMALLGNSPRGATCEAIDHVELVKIKADDFHLLLRQFPQVTQKIKETVEKRETSNRYLLKVPRNTSLDDFLDQGLIEAQTLLVLDLKKCTRCDACVDACADTHDGVTRLIRDGLRYENYLVATSCRQCMDPLCMIGCPVGSIRRKDSLEIIIEDWCIGCNLCAKNCPYGNINMHPFNVMEEDHKNPGVMKAVTKKKATTCDLCTDLAEPSCTYACPHDAAHRINPKEFFDFEKQHKGEDLLVQLLKKADHVTE